MFAFECIPGNHTPPMPWDAQEFIALNFQVDSGQMSSDVGWLFVSFLR